jgi:hypothetical protein
MSRRDRAHPAAPITSAPDQLQHLGIAGLTIIHGRAQLLERAIRQSPSLPPAERTWLLAGLATIETAVHTVLPAIASQARTTPDGGER